MSACLPSCSQSGEGGVVAVVKVVDGEAEVVGVVV